MTYCVGLMMDAGLIFMSDTRTNAGVDNVSVFKKMHTWHVPGKRQIVLMSAGNLATTQAVVSTLSERTKAPEERGSTFLEQPSMFQTAQMVGDTLHDVITRAAGAAGQTAESAFSASLILGGQIAGAEPRLFLIYPEGNFIEATDDTPFLQIGETKYGRPIIVRAFRRDMSFDEGMKLLLVSFDSTIRANLSVGTPLDMVLMERGNLDSLTEHRIDGEDPQYRTISTGWSTALQIALENLPGYSLRDD